MSETVDDYKKRIIELNDRFFLILENYTKTFPMYKADPNYKQYSDIMAIYKGQLTALQRDLLMTKNSIDINVNKTNSTIISNDKKIDELIVLNEKLQDNLNQLKNKAAGAKGLIKEERYLYNAHLLKLTTLIVGSIIIGVMIYIKR